MEYLPWKFQNSHGKIRGGIHSTEAVVIRKKSKKKCIALFPSNDLCLSNMKKLLLIILINGDSTTDAFQEIF